MRQPPLDFGPQLEYRTPLSGNPTRRRWRRYIDHLLELNEGSFDLLVVDTVMHFLPASLTNATALRKPLSELRLIASAVPAGVLLLHQTSAARSRSRARGPLPAFADILVDLQVPHGDPFSRCRHFVGVGRYPGTLAHVTAELNAAGTDYVLLPDAAADPALATLQRVLSASPAPLTRQEILARWPASEPPPRADSLWRTLTCACAMGLLVRTGAGTKAEAFRYGLAGTKPAG